MAQLRQVSDPFGEVNVYQKPDRSLEIVATILMEPDIEGSVCGLALDASASMKTMYGAGRALSPLFASSAINLVEPVAKTMASYLAKFSSVNRVNMLYWACSPDGTQIEPIGDLSETEIQHLSITGPRKQPWGRGTKLLPPLRYFSEDVFRQAPWAICVFITDGIIEDLAEVKKFSIKLAKDIASGKRKFMKLVLLGVGEEVDQAQMEELDDMFNDSDLRTPEGDEIDLWDHKLTSEMRQLAEIFAEVVSEHITVASSGRIYDHQQRVVKEYKDGLPSLLRFTLPAGATSFTLEFGGHRVTQSLL